VINTQLKRRHLEQRAAYVQEWRTQKLYLDLPLHEEVRRGLDRFRHTPIVITGDNCDFTSTVGEVHAEAEALAGSLAGLGFRARDVIAAQLPNCRENLVTFLAALRLGLVFVPIVMIYGPAELGFILRQSGARALVIMDRWRKVDMRARLAALPPLPGLEHIFVVGSDSLPGPVMHWEALSNRPRAAIPERSTSDPAHPADQICLINYTSGSTAESKGVMHSHNTLSAETRNYGAVIDVSANLAVVPAGHIGSPILMLTPFLRGIGIVFANAWEPEVLMELVERHSIAQVGSVPTNLASLLDLARIPACIRYGMTGGAGVPPALIERGHARGIVMVRSYGSTEHPTVTASMVTESLDERRHGNGRPAPGSRLRILDDDGVEVPQGREGEVASMGPELFQGYFDPALDADAFTADGWYKSGDIGVVNEYGSLVIVDRKKDIIIRGGENISSHEVENILVRHPAVMESAAVAWPDERYGERVAVFVKLRPGRSLDMPQLQAHFAAQGVARQKTPEQLILVEEFERTAFGKVRKPLLRERARQLAAQAARKA
jgi:acyl-CoA synthetase (AMP-forming)/AMP-acid ligase II